MRSTLGVLAASAAVFLAPAAAQADELGGLEITPGASADIAVIQLRTSAGCPAQADAYYATVTGSGFAAPGAVVVPNGSAGLSHDGPFVVHLQQTMKDFAADAGTTLSGGYTFTVFCIDSFSQRSFGEFTGALRFATPTRYEAIGDAKGPDRLPDPSTEPAAPGPGTPSDGSPGQAQGAPEQAPAQAPEQAPARASDNDAAAGTADASGGLEPFLYVAGGALGAAALGLVFGAVRRKKPVTTSTKTEE
ncbi:hypothetical protein ABZ863_12910 [Saccharomonospora sp. NPDC046836]|uniref:hypothetical protein n=1 Tax=Saccharomonospora sp. NPDC046836 TaxID=3156921 RepID=UPI0033D2A6FC